jgi:hypothetical protein
MTERKRKRPAVPRIPFSEALAKFINTDPRELAEAVAADVINARERAQRRVEEARKEIADGSRPGKGRFRL